MFYAYTSFIADINNDTINQGFQLQVTPPLQNQRVAILHE